MGGGDHPLALPKAATLGWGVLGGKIAIDVYRGRGMFDVEVEWVFAESKGRFAWPWITCICNVCPDNLPFEIEAAACMWTVS